ncbi:MAG: PAS domain-containing protein [Deltaproteobacteria bacterium]|nr:PAS domain-containing protein [Deltaproteobacteria bacterium]MDQ3295472.1 PAS domain-containing protein [Myxococcota bacterium]
MSTVETIDAQLSRGKLRIAQLEREAIEQSGDAAKALRVQLDRYQSLVLAMAQLIWTTDENGEMVGEQPSWSAYTGQTIEQYGRRGWIDAVHPDDRANDLQLWEHAVVARGPCEYEHRLRRHDGEYRYFSVRAVPVFGDDGAIREWAGIHSDITQRKLTEQSLRDGERRFRELADAMPQIVWSARPDGTFDYYNRRWYELTGRVDGVIGDQSWADVVHPADQPEVLARWHQALETGTAYEIEYRLRRKEGDHRWYLRRVVPIHDAEGKITRWLGTCTDIDQRRRSEDQLRSSALQLSQSNRELENFASVASHDLQEPLRKIHSFVDCLRDEQAATLNADGLDYLRRIQNAAVRMTTLVSDLLEFSRVSSLGKPFVPVDLDEVVAGVASDLEARLRQTGGRLEIEALPTVASDQLQMRQLFLNLIGNALKFHRKDTPPVVRVTGELIMGLDADGRARPAAGCRISVSDNGIGFDEKYLDRVFTIFQRLHGRGVYEGTGIGLAICRRIVERHGGSITATSKPGEGSTFSFTLPIAQRNGASLGS